jgi:hypothetical protein
MGFEPTLGDPSGLAVHRLNRSATVSKRLAGPPREQPEFKYDANTKSAERFTEDLRMVARQMNENDGRQLLQRLHNAGLETPTFWWEVSYFADVCCGLFARLIETENSDFKLEGGLDACACTLSPYRSAVCLRHVLRILACRCVCAVSVFCVLFVARGRRVRIECTKERIKCMHPSRCACLQQYITAIRVCKRPATSSFVDCAEVVTMLSCSSALHR